ncbi:MAG: MBL fold metallo-hydrolase, partial [Planctomycetaceae bacterium]|nr:MBL fold metallo-hydrolase [Planctomycetaceae bacterium]
MFHWDDGLKLTRADLAIDFRRRQPRAFISHAHADHIARHEYALCTPETAALYQHRLGPRPTRAMPYREPIVWGGLRLTTYPAGHCLGSAMLLAEDGDQSLLYTGDFKLGESATAARAELPHADTLVIESTYGHPDYRLPPRQQAVEQLVTLVRETLARDAVPVIEAYSLGKAQEVTRLLTDVGIPVLQHGQVYAVSRVYESFGVSLGRHELLKSDYKSGWAVISPPNVGRLEWLGRQVRIAATGWAVDPRSKYRLGVDHAVPLSDHADYDELFQAVAMVNPRIIYCTHGPEQFVDRLCEAGYDAHVLGRPLRQAR